MKNVIFIAAFIFAWNVSADYLKERNAAAALDRAKKYDEAIKAFVELADKTDLRDRNFECLRKAALIAYKHKNYEGALDLADKIKYKPLAKSCRMEIMLTNRKYKELIEMFKNEDIDVWPENCIGKGFYYRGEAYRAMKNGTSAEADLVNAFKNGVYPGKWRAMISRAYNFQKNLNDEDKALACFMQMTDGSITFSWLIGDALINAISILIKQQKYDEAIRILQNYDVNKMRGYWKATLLAGYASIYAAQGKKAEAVAKYKEASETKGISQAKVESFLKKISSLEKTLSK